MLSYAPGGFAEMSLIGLALGIEVAMVATHHLFRLFLIILTGPIVFRTLLKRGPASWRGGGVVSVRASLRLRALTRGRVGSRRPRFDYARSVMPPSTTSRWPFT